jgi:hypothetical protein
MGTVINRFWNGVPRTQTQDSNEVVVVARHSLDALAAAVDMARNRVVHLQCELHKAEDAYKEAQQIWSDAVLDRGAELGIAEFCQIRSRRPPPKRHED